MKVRELVDVKGMENAILDFLATANEDKSFRFHIKPHYLPNIGITACNRLKGEKDFTLYFNLNCLFDNDPEGVGFISGNMNRRNKTISGFSRITKILLHELGHVATIHKVCDTYKDFREMQAEKEWNCHSNADYLLCPDEWAATEWALNWINSKENRSIARRFEKRFWDCFAEI